MSAHDDFLVDIPGLLAGELPDARKVEVEQHFAGCADCSVVFTEMSETVNFASALPLEYQPPQRLEEKTFALIEMEREKEQRTVRTVPEPARWSRARDEARRRWFSPRALLAPGLAAVFIALAVVSASLWAQKSDLENQLEQERGGSGEEVAEVELVAAADADTQATARLIQLDGENLRIELDTSNLPAPPKDYHYELWLGTGEDGWASAGTFETSGEDGEFTFMTAVDPLKFPVVDITLEREDGAPERDGQGVMRGRVDLSEIGA
jgi:Anti-sigma-K factor rskA/Putative zinc-finger